MTSDTVFNAYDYIGAAVSLSLFKHFCTSPEQYQQLFADQTIADSSI